jgi:spermidine synthase
LIHGNTTHGAQSTVPGRRLELLTYYHPTGPVGQVYGALAAPTAAAEVGVIGLGTGSLACYGRPGQHWTFFEIDPAVARIARNPDLFTFLRDCPPRSDVTLGDARLSLDRVRPHRFGMIVLDAFNSDAIPVHLLTRQALALYLDKLTDGGVIAVNITNRYLDLRGVLGDLARDAHLAALAREDLRVSKARVAEGAAGSVWAVLARHPADLAPLAGDARWQALPSRPGTRVWTDDFSNLLSALKRG